MVDMQRQHATSTKNAGSSLANCDLVSARIHYMNVRIKIYATDISSV